MRRNTTLRSRSQNRCHSAMTVSDSSGSGLIFVGPGVKVGALKMREWKMQEWKKRE